VQLVRLLSQVEGVAHLPRDNDVQSLGLKGVEAVEDPVGVDVAPKRVEGA